MRKKHYYEAMAMADSILEGHTQEETAEEFGVSRRTVNRRINELETHRPDVYKKVIAYWHKNDDFEGLLIDD